MSTFDEFYDSRRCVNRLAPPVLRGAIKASDAKVWPTAPLAACLGDLERMLVVSASAPLTLDRLIGQDAPGRGAGLVQACVQAVQERPEIGQHIRGAALALKQDKSGRMTALATEPAMRAVQRGAMVLIRPAGAVDAMETAPASATV